METAPQFIWRALQNTPTVIAEARNKPIEYNLGVEVYDVPDERCWLCAGQTNGRGILVKDRIDSMFSDVHLACWPESQSLCEGCAGLLRQRMFRMYSCLATQEGVRHLARDAWADILTCPPEPPWAACLAVSGQKHLFFKTEVNRQNQLVYVQMEDLGIRFDPQELSELLTVVERLYTIFSKSEILTGDYSSMRIQQYGIHEWERDTWYVSNYRGERLLELAVWIARKDEEAREARLEEAKRRKAERAKAAQEPLEATDVTGQLSLF